MNSRSRVTGESASPTSIRRSAGTTSRAQPTHGQPTHRQRTHGPPPDAFLVDVALRNSIDDSEEAESSASIATIGIGGGVQWGWCGV